MVFNQGPTLIIVKTKLGAICGGFTSKGWGTQTDQKIQDSDAFVFNMEKKFTPENIDNPL